MKPETPILMLTRPRAGSEAFAAALSLGVRTVVSPLYELDAVPFDGGGAWEEAIFTSARAVAEVGPGGGRRAWCVGPSTTEAASRAGFAGVEAGGDVEGLICAILSARPKGALRHFRGQSSVGDVAARLRDAGLRCDERIVYRKAVRGLTDEAREVLRGEVPVVLPLFSAETVSILVEYGPFAVPLWCVCISEAVADRVRDLLAPASCVVASQPNRAGMVAATRAAFA